MPRPKQYSDNAEKQAAYRERHPERKPAPQDRLAMLARSLHLVLQEAIEQDKCPLPHRILDARADLTLRNLIYYLDPDPDPVRYYGMDGMPRANAAGSPKTRAVNPASHRTSKAALKE